MKNALEHTDDAPVSGIVGSTVSVESARDAGRILDILLVAVLVLSSVTFYWLATHGTWNPRHDQVPRVRVTGQFFLAQARGILRARLWVLPSQTAYDCFIHNGKCYGYFGLTPSFLRLPFLALLDHYNNGFTPVFITAGLTLATGSMLASLRHFVSQILMTKTTVVVVALVALGLGAGSVLTLLTQPDVYDEAIVWAVAFLSLAIFCFIRWWEVQRPRWYVLLLISLVLATNARPTALPFALVVGLGVGVRLWQRSSALDSRNWTLPLILGGMMVVLPIATCIGVFMVKFGQPIPSYLLDQQIAGAHATPRWIKIRRIDHNHLTSLRFVPTALFAYLRPDVIDFSRSFPWVYFRFRTTFRYTGFVASPITYIGLSRGSLYSGTVASLTATMPLCFIIAIAAAGYRLGQRAKSGIRAWSPSRILKSETLWKPILLVAALGSWGVALTGVAVEDRFLADAYPLVALFVLLGLPRLVRKVNGAGRLIAMSVATLVIVGVSWQLLANIGLAWRFPGA